MRRTYIWAGIIGAVLLLITASTWYIGYANTTHPAPWPMVGGDAGHRHRAGSALPQQVSLKWTFPLRLNDVLTAPVVGEDGTVYVAGGSRLTALSPAGKQQWAWSSQTPITSLALGRQGEVYAQAYDAVYAFSATGQMQWKLPIETEAIFPMVVGQGGTIYAAGREYLYAITADGDLKWRFRGRRISVGPVETPRGQILVAIDDVLYSLNRDGDDTWSVRIPEMSGYLSVTVGADGRIWAKGDSLYMIDPMDGSLVANMELQRPIFTNVAHGRDFLQYGFTRYNRDGVKTSDLKSLPGAFAFATVLDPGGNALLVSARSALLDGRITNIRTSPDFFAGLAMIDADGRTVWTYGENLPIDMRIAVAGGQIYYIGMVDVKSGTVGLIALGSP